MFVDDIGLFFYTLNEDADKLLPFFFLFTFVWFGFFFSYVISIFFRCIDSEKLENSVQKMHNILLDSIAKLQKKVQKHQIVLQNCDLKGTA